MSASLLTHRRLQSPQLGRHFWRGLSCHLRVLSCPRCLPALAACSWSAPCSSSCPTLASMPRPRRRLAMLAALMVSWARVPAPCTSPSALSPLAAALCGLSPRRWRRDRVPVKQPRLRPPPTCLTVAVRASRPRARAPSPTRSPSLLARLGPLAVLPVALISMGTETETETEGVALPTLAPRMHRRHASASASAIDVAVACGLVHIALRNPQAVHWRVRLGGTCQPGEPVSVWTWTEIRVTTCVPSEVPMCVLGALMWRHWHASAI